MLAAHVLWVGTMIRIAALLMLLVALAPAAGAASGEALLLEVDGPIGPATGDYVRSGLETAREQGSAVVILRMDTPGGLDTAMRDIIKDIIGSAVPVVTYVAPGGARAASAGTYILYASHVAAMAPATNLGAATPVQIGGGGPPGLPSQPEEEPPAGTPEGEGDGEGTAEPQPGTAMERKMVNDAVAYIRALAELRGRNADWAEKAVRQAASLSAEEALEMGVIDVMAEDVSALLDEIDGRTVSMETGERTLETAGLDVRVQEPDWRNRLLAVITNPNVAYILMLVGIYGLIFELANPGALVPGVIGGIALLLALFAFQALPVNYAGLALILLGALFMVAEAFVPSFGALGLGGVIAFVIGSIMLIDTDAPGFELSLMLVLGFSLASLFLLMGAATLAVRAHRRPVVSGAQQMRGSIGTVIEPVGEGYRVRVHGEIWRARSRQALEAGQPVRVTAMEGLLLQVEPVEDGD